MARITRRIPIGQAKSFSIVLDDSQSDPFAQSLQQRCFWIRDEWELISSFLPAAGGRFLDLGGHLGTFSLTAAAHGHDVLVVEAAPTNAALIEASAKANDFTNMTVVHAAVYREPALLRFYENGPFGFLVERDEENLASVSALPVSEILARHGWDRVDFLKMDIEGSEVWAIEGMNELLARPDAPVLFYESNGTTLHDFGHSSCHELRARLELLGYQSYEFVDRRTPLLPVNASEPQPDRAPNCLAVKRNAFAFQRLPAWRQRIGNLLRRCVGRRPIEAWLNGWAIGRPSDNHDLIERFQRAIPDATDPNIRQHLLRELALATANVRSDPVIEDFLMQSIPAARAA
jgi:FkbM family methyltransferase